MSYQHRLPLSVCAVLAATVATAPMHVQAANSTDSSDVVSLEEITVTARKRSEDILQTPVSVIALTAGDLEARGLVSITDIAIATPGINFNAASSGRSDRTFAQFIIRGFTPSQSDFPAASTFLDGVPISSATELQNIDDPERVEILKGPQSAYFGRSTFSGAINVVTKVPGDSFAGSVSTTLGTRNNSDVHADFGGPLLGDALGFRASFRKYSKDGSYKNYADPSQTLGDQSTTMGTLALVSKPLDGLTIKLFGLLTKDNDGAPAQALISSRQITDANGNVLVANQSNCTLTGRAAGSPGAPAFNTRTSNPYICGTVPGPSQFSPAANTVMTPALTAFLNNPKGRLLNPADGTNHFGKVSKAYHWHAIADYELGTTGFKITSLTGANRETYSTLVDLDNYDSGAFQFPFLVERARHDVSQEFRLSYDKQGSFRGIGGVSYIDAWNTQGLGGVPGISGSGSAVSGAQRNKTSGVFFGLSYDFNQLFTLDIEGRYQIDKLIAYSQPNGTNLTNSTFAPAGFYPSGAVLLSQEFKNFVPRVILKYNITSDVISYASVSQGVNPGQFNTTFLTFSGPLQQQAAATGIKIGVTPEKVTNYEVGLKGKFFDNRLRLSSAIYYAKWKDQINLVQLVAIDPLTGIAQLATGSTNAGVVDMKGIEFDAEALFLDHVTVNLAGALNDSNIKTLVNPALTQLTGLAGSDYDGKQMPLTSKYSANFGVQYDAKLANVDDASWFARADLTYKSGVYSNAANIVKTPDVTRVNFRLGLNKGPASVEVFVKNAFNNGTYDSILDNFIFTPTFAFAGVNSAVIGGLPDLRTYGVKAKYKF